MQKNNLLRDNFQLLVQQTIPPNKSYNIFPFVKAIQGYNSNAYQKHTSKTWTCQHIQRTNVPNPFGRI